MYIHILPVKGLEQNVFDGWLYSGNSSTTSTGQNFTFYLNDAETEAMLRFKFGSIFVQNGSCSEGYNLSVCYLGAIFGYYDTNRYDPRYGTTFTAWNKAHVTITATTYFTELNVTWRFEKTEFLLGEQGKVWTRIENIGEVPATNVVYFEEYPQSMFQVTLLSPCELNEGRSFWSGILNPMVVKECAFLLTAKASGESASKLSVSYHNGIDSKNYAAEQLLKVAGLGLKTESSIPSNLTSGEEFYVNFTLTASQNVTVEYFTLSIPDNVKLLGAGNLETTGFHKFNYIGSLTSGGNISLWLKLQAIGNGTGVIEQSTKYFYLNSVETYGANYTFSMTMGAPYIKLSATNFSAGRNTIGIFIVNPTQFIFKDLNLRVESPLVATASEEYFQELPVISHKETKIDFDASGGEYPVYITLNYSSVYGYPFIIKTTETLAISATQGESAPISAEDNATTVATTTRRQGGIAAREPGSSGSSSNASSTKVSINSKWINISLSKNVYIFGITALIIIAIAITSYVLHKKNQDFWNH